MHNEGSLLEKVYLKPGELVITEEPVIVTTVLGSCVSVTMFHPRTGAAAICHGMLPNGGNSDSFKYVDTSLRYMVKYFDRSKITRKEILVKLFGGADMFNSAQSGVRNLTVGWQNILVATRCLEEYGLVPTASDVGGRRGRKLVFKTDTGTVFIKKINEQALMPGGVPLCR
jgi:chemotaxis protein CheD